MTTPAVVLAIILWLAASIALVLLWGKFARASNTPQDDAADLAEALRPDAYMQECADALKGIQVEREAQRAALLESRIASNLFELVELRSFPATLPLIMHRTRIHCEIIDDEQELADIRRRADPPYPGDRRQAAAFYEGRM